jgi:Holliday junction resolvase
MRRAAKVDANHAEIRDGMRKAGFAVFDCAGLGRGLPDLIAVKAGRVVFIEVKDGSKVPSARKLTEAQQKVHAAFTANGYPIQVITSVEEAVRL